MVYTLKDIKHLETIANLQSKEVEQSKPIFVQAEDTSLTATILKLCNKLRAEGHNKYAESVENKFVNYKTAGVHLYQAHKETGEDLVDQAHPDGDNKIVSDVSDNNGDVETIVSKHKKIVDIVNKQPTGKLASYVEQCKIALGQSITMPKTIDTMNIRELINSANEDIQKIYNMIVKSGGISSIRLSDIRDRMSLISNLVNTPIKDMSADEINKAVSGVSAISQWLHPNLLHNYLPDLINKGVSTDELWDKISGILNGATSKLKSAISKLVDEQYKDEPKDNVSVKQNPQADSITENFQSMMALITQLESQVNNGKSTNKAAQLAWLDQMNQAVGDKMAQYSSIQNKEPVAKEYTDLLGQVKQRLDAFKSKLG